MDNLTDIKKGDRLFACGSFGEKLKPVKVERLTNAFGFTECNIKFRLSDGQIYATEANKYITVHHRTVKRPTPYLEKRYEAEQKAIAAQKTVNTEKSRLRENTDKLRSGYFSILNDDSEAMARISNAIEFEIMVKLESAKQQIASP